MLLKYNENKKFRQKTVYICTELGGGGAIIMGKKEDEEDA